MGLVPLYKETPESSLAPFTMSGGGHSKKTPSMNLRLALTRPWICQCHDLGLLASRSVRHKFRHPVYGILPEQPKRTNKCFKAFFPLIFPLTFCVKFTSISSLGCYQKGVFAFTVSSNWLLLINVYETYWFLCNNFVLHYFSKSSGSF